MNTATNAAPDIGPDTGPDTEPMHPMLTRRPDWPEQLAHHLILRGTLPFAWGVNDCALFAADAVLAMTGEDVMADLRGAYGSSEEAARIIGRAGGLLAMVSERLPVYVSPLQAHRGDVVCVEITDPDTGKPRWTAGIVAGNGYWAAPGLQHVEYRPMAEVLHAFAVG